MIIMFTVCNVKKHKNQAKYISFHFNEILKTTPNSPGGICLSSSFFISEAWPQGLHQFLPHGDFEATCHGDGIATKATILSCSSAIFGETPGGGNFGEAPVGVEIWYISPWLTSWWFQPLWKISVKLGIGVKIKNNCRSLIIQTR